MTKKPIPQAGLRVGKMKLRGRIIRDLFNTRGPVVIDELEVEADIGGDAVKTAPAQKRKCKKRTTQKAITHLLATAVSIGSMVAASGIAYAVGWL
ncbi:MAG: hypothetical protein AB7H66_11215 [Hyphomonadaceae bacterium]